MTHRLLLGLLPLALLACGRATPPGSVPPSVARVASAEQVNALWTRAERDFRRGKWGKAADLLQRLTLEFAPGDARIPRAHFYLGESYFGMRNHLQAVREFRRVADEHPNHPLAAEALLRAGDTYADLWRRPELDPTYGQTALGTYQELLSRWPDSPPAARAQVKIARLQERFAYKDYRSALFYFRYKAYDSAILYLRGILAEYPRTPVVPDALRKLIEAFRILGYQEDLAETCDYLRRFHPDEPLPEQGCAPPDGGQ